MIIILSIFIVLSIHISNAQQSAGLVNNGRFELYVKCPNNYLSKKKFIPFWYSPTKGTPDYFNICSKYRAGIPKNFAGYSDAKSGKGYTGIILVHDPNTVFTEKMYLREYITTILNEDLKKGKLYIIMLSISLADYSRFATDEIGVYFSGKKPNNRTNLHLPYSPQIVFNDKMLENDTSWVDLKAVYKATGGEKYLTIGNFETQKEVNWKERDLQHIRKDKIVDYAYYYIDDVALTPIENTPIKEKDFTY